MHTRDTKRTNRFCECVWYYCSLLRKKFRIVNFNAFHNVNAALDNSAPVQPPQCPVGLMLSLELKFVNLCSTFKIKRKMIMCWRRGWSSLQRGPASSACVTEALGQVCSIWYLLFCNKQIPWRSDSLCQGFRS